MKTNKGRKITVLDELGIKGGGIYAIMPFERLDKYGKALFKVGYAKTFKSRVESYHTTYPMGFYFVAMLKDPVGLNRERKKPTMKLETLSKDKYLLRVEKFIFNAMKNDGAIKDRARQLTSTTRVRNPDAEKKGATEWFYTTVETIHKAFEKAYEIYGGDLHLYHLDNINQTADETKRKQKAKYVGEIVYFV